MTSFEWHRTKHQRKAYLNESAVKKSLIFDDAKIMMRHFNRKYTENLTALARDNDEVVLDFPRGTLKSVLYCIVILKRCLLLN